MLLVHIRWIFCGFSTENAQGFFGLCDYAFITDPEFSGNPCIFAFWALGLFFFLRCFINLELFEKRCDKLKYSPEERTICHFSGSVYLGLKLALAKEWWYSLTGVWNWMRQSHLRVFYLPKVVEVKEKV